MNRRTDSSLVCCVLCCCAMSGRAAAQWSHFAHGPDRVSRVGAAPSIKTPRWLANHDAMGQAILFNGQSGVVADAAHAYATGQSGGIHRVYAIRIADGEVAWQSTMAPPYLGSWSTPALDESNASVIVASGNTVRALNTVTGASRWESPLDRPVVNASPVVTSDRGPRDRVFVTDFDGFGAAGSLYCINTDPHNAALNPFDPGHRLWSVPLGGTSGNTPAYRAGIVYVASTSDASGAAPGLIRAFSAASLEPPTPIWTFTNPAGHGFFAGVCVHEEPGGLFVYAASYAFTGGQDAANLVKLAATDGSLVWSAPCNRTDATPIPLGGGRVVVSGGVPGFGSAPSIQLFQETGGSAVRLWDTALDTWTDLNGNGSMEPGEYLLVGGWTHQPVATVGAAGNRILAGATPLSAWTAPCTDLYLLDLTRQPDDPAFILEHATNAGSTPAVAAGAVFTIGAAGLYALGPCYPDCTGDAALTVADFGCFQTRFAAGDPYADCTGDGALTVSDFGCFQTSFVSGCP